MTVPSAWDYGKVEAVPAAIVGGAAGGAAGLGLGGLLDVTRDIEFTAPSLWPAIKPKGNVFARNRGAILGSALGTLAGAGLLGGVGLLGGAAQGALQNAYLGEDSGWVPYVTGSGGAALGGAAGAALGGKLMPGAKGKILGGILGGVPGMLGGWELGGALNRHTPDSWNAPIVGGLLGAPIASAGAQLATGSKSKMPAVLGALAGAMIANRMAGGKKEDDGNKASDGEDAEE